MTKIRPSGGYRSTASFQTATMIYDATNGFVRSSSILTAEWQTRWFKRRV